MRILQQVVGKGVLRRALRIAQRAGLQARQGIHDDQGRQFAARQNIVADGDLVGHEMLPHPLVHALVVAAEQDQMRFLRPEARRLLREQRAARIGHRDARRRSHPAVKSSSASAIGSIFMTMPPPPP